MRFFVQWIGHWTKMPVVGFCCLGCTGQPGDLLDQSCFGKIESWLYSCKSTHALDVVQLPWLYSHFFVSAIMATVIVLFQPSWLQWLFCFSHHGHRSWKYFFIGFKPCACDFSDCIQNHCSFKVSYLANQRRCTALWIKLACVLYFQVLSYLGWCQWGLCISYMSRHGRLKKKAGALWLYRHCVAI